MTEIEIGDAMILRLHETKLVALATVLYTFNLKNVSIFALKAKLQKYQNGKLLEQKEK